MIQAAQGLKNPHTERLMASVRQTGEEPLPIPDIHEPIVYRTYLYGPSDDFASYLSG